MSRTIIGGIWVAFFQECQQQSCGQVDSLFKEGGGAESLPQFSAEIAELRKHHPNATTWLSPCGDDEAS